MSRYPTVFDGIEPGRPYAAPSSTWLSTPRPIHPIIRQPRRPIWSRIHPLAYSYAPSRTCSTDGRPFNLCPMLSLSASLPLTVALLVVVLFDSTSGWKRYEKRVLDCANVNATTCSMETSSGEKRTVSCRREPIPLADHTKLNSNATYRLACPVGCKIHIVQQAHAVNRKCLSFSTFGKYFDVEAQDWYIWFCEPCQAVFSTNCEFEK
ncbi:unnamed protein product [Heligmosomoides polygyrus]|uniref:DAN domain-containing protein n=1 Tax=Heligmosomoides polygyrus TaxID=6339 RepID=A0A183FUI8_HELPZ|nr:unnamed protein product [Heligmosomoides polygyrus]